MSPLPLLPDRSARPSFVVALLAATLVGTASLAAPLAAQPGVSFTYQMKSTGTPQKGQASPVVTAAVRAAGSNMRIEWRDGTPGVPMMKPGSYMVIRGADKTLLMVSPQDKSAMVIDAQGFGAGAGSMTNNALVKISQKDSKFDYEDLGAGDRILGYPTRRVRISSSATTDIRVLGKTNSSTSSTTGETWVATNIKGVAPEALRQWTQAFGRGVQRTNADLMPRLVDYEKKYGDGLALRSNVVTSSTDEKGRARTDTIHMEVTELAAATLDPSIFEVPKGYEVTDMRQMGAALEARRSAADSAAGGDADKASVKEGALKGALGGFLKRKKP